MPIHECRWTLCALDRPLTTARRRSRLRRWRHSHPRRQRRACSHGGIPRRFPLGSVREHRAVAVSERCFWNHEVAAGLVPAGTIPDQGCDCTRGYLGADLGQMQIGAFRVGCRGDDRRTHCAGRADGTEDVGGVVAVIPHHRRTRTNGRPDIAERAFLPDPGFVLKPYLDGCSGSTGAKCFLQSRTEVFLKASCAARSFLG